MLINSETPGSKVIGFKAQKMTVSSLPAVVRGDFGLSANFPNLYRMFSLNIG
jgi:hypothetical protein